LRLFSCAHEHEIVKPLEILGETLAPDGAILRLARRDTEFIILANGRSLMSSRMHGSEEALASFTCAPLRKVEEPCVLIGGLGMGFTLRATLDMLPPDATVIVAEMVADVVEWNRGALGALADYPMKDKRVHIEIGDVAEKLKTAQAKFDAILLDVDNGPTAFTSSANSWLYGDRGIAAARAALKMGGMLGVWSARGDRKFEQRLRYGRFSVRVEDVRARLKKGGPRHTIFLGHKTASH
jgi:spermidine synthase